MDVRPIRTDEDHESALREIDRLWDAKEGTDDADLLEVLVTLVHAYEERTFEPIRARPLDVLKFMMEQNGRTQADLSDLLKSRSRASEILSGKRELTLDQIRLLHREWHIPAGALVGDLEHA